ncbi:2OG-Fe(II) oxygenase [Bacillus paranthracis]|uniref:2OG-Fe(II) oxygenase n=1 Tax=Bacillus paranthracis TaxID=2026186 RepID=UPI00298CE790|nr:2OG-Fe(II) oxygenase [Bacillus paranthracis]
MSTIEEEQIQFKETYIYQEPFKHVYIKEVLPPDIAKNILEWLGKTDLFLKRNENNNKSNEFIINSKDCPDHLKSFFSVQNLRIIKDKIQQIFEVTFKDEFTLSAVKHIKGNGTSIHSDYAKLEQRDENFFTHRFLLYLNENWEKNDGGRLGIFLSKEPSSLIKAIPPLHNTGVGIAFGKNTYHAVEKINNKNRFSLVFTFKTINEAYEEEMY